MRDGGRDHYSRHSVEGRLGSGQFPRSSHAALLPLCGFRSRRALMSLFAHSGPGLSLLPCDQSVNYFYVLGSFQTFEISKVKIFWLVFYKLFLIKKKKFLCMKDFKYFNYFLKKTLELSFLACGLAAILLGGNSNVYSKFSLPWNSRAYRLLWMFRCLP